MSYSDEQLREDVVITYDELLHALDAYGDGLDQRDDAS